MTVAPFYDVPFVWRENETKNNNQLFDRVYRTAAHVKGRRQQFGVRPTFKRADVFLVTKVYCVTYRQTTRSFIGTCDDLSLMSDVSTAHVRSRRLVVIILAPRQRSHATTHDTYRKKNNILFCLHEAMRELHVHLRG